MVETATGLVLRTRPLTETSLIVHWLTKDLGRLATVAKGAHRPQSSFRGKLDLFYLADFSFARSRRSELHTLREVRLLNTHKALRENITYLQQAAYCATLVEQCTETETPLTEVFVLFHGFLEHLPLQPAQPRSIFTFELKLLDELGLGPDVQTVNLGQETRTLITSLKDGGWPDLGKLKANRTQVEEMRRFLHEFLLYHLGKIPRGRETALGLAAAQKDKLA